MERGFIKRFVNEFTGILRGEAVLVYTMGKVGTSTLESSLKASGILAIHVHNFSGEEYGHLDKRLYASVGLRCFRMAYKARLRIFSIAMKLAPRVRIISMVRGPVARNLSSMFQGLDRLMFQATQLDADAPEDDVLQYIFDEYINHESAVTWFHDEFYKTTGIDIEEYPHEQRDVLRADKGRYTALIIKLESLDGAEEEIARFIDVPTFKLIRSNDSSTKWYYPLYSEFKKDLKLSPEYLERMFEAPYLKRFYSESEISAMKKKWARNLTNE